MNMRRIDLPRQINTSSRILREHGAMTVYKDTGNDARGATNIAWIGRCKCNGCAIPPGDLGVNVAYVWVGTIALALMWAFFCVPELADLSTREVDMLFEQKVPAWRSKKWSKQLRTVNGVDPTSENSDKGVQSQDIIAKR
ncbi:hypothetical protein V1527DRAFT_493453 [Lipomyces starkeyi]